MLQQLLSQYSVGEIITFIIILALATKQFIEFCDWVIKKVSNRDTKQINHYEAEKRLAERLDELEKNSIETNKALAELKDCIRLLIDSDKDAIKAYITEKHHHFCYEQLYIDDYSLDCLEKRYGHYVEEKGNSFIEKLMNELRELPHQSESERLINELNQQGKTEILMSELRDLPRQTESEQGA